MEEWNRNTMMFFKQSLKGDCQDIYERIISLEAGSEQRAIWELVQNAHDVSDECVIKIVLKEGLFTFSHQGSPFDIISLGALVMQNSSKKYHDKGTIGRYGTGFITTHILSREVRIHSTLDYTDEDGKHLSYHPFDLEIDRSGNSPEELLPKMKATLDNISKINETNTVIETPAQWTTFEYPITSGTAEKLGSILKEAKRLLPFVLLINNKISNFSINDDISGNTYKIQKGTKVLSEVINGCSGWQHISQLVEETQNGVSKQKAIHYLQSDKGDIVFIPYKDSLGDVNIDALPKLFLWLPLIGSEDFGVNFIFHSGRFTPVEKRNNILLPHNNDQTKNEQEQNERALKEMYNAIFAYYRSAINAQLLNREYCRIYFTNHDNEEDEVLTGFYNRQQKLWSDEVSTWSVIPTEQGYCSISTPHVRVLHPDFYTLLDEPQIKEYEPIIRHFASIVEINGTQIVLPKEDLIAWSKVVNEWGIDAENACVAVEQVCEAIKSDSGELQSFLRLLKVIGKVELFNIYALIPNREKQLQLKENLYDGKNISPDLYRMVRPILGKKLDCIVDEQYVDFIDRREYTRSDLQATLTDTISKLRKVSLTAVESRPLEETEGGKSLLYALLDFCSAFPTENLTLRKNIMPSICEIYECQQNEIIIPNDANSATNVVDIYETSFNYLLDNTLLTISKKDENWVAVHKELLLNFLFILSTQTKDKEHLERLKRNKVFPNQRGKLCFANVLKWSENVNQDFVDEYSKIMGVDLYEKWVDEKFRNLVEFEKENPKELGKQIEDKLEPYLIQKRNKDNSSIYDEIIEKSLLIITYRLEQHQWEEYFDHFVRDLRDISYELGTKEQKDALYKIKKNIHEQSVLDKIANLTEFTDLNKILETAETVVKEERERQRQFNFMFAVGKTIENAIRQEVSQEVKVEYKQDYSIIDEQGGQDIIIRKAGEPIYYIECKAKWEFHDNPARMSSLQVKNAIRNKENYALICVNCTQDGANISLDASLTEVESAISEILVNTKVLTNIGYLLDNSLGGFIKYEDGLAKIDDEEQIKVYGNMDCRIPKRVFTSGIPFDKFIAELKLILQN